MPLDVGTEYDGHKIVEVIEHDPTDAYQPFLYLLDNGDTVWIPVESENYSLTLTQ